MYKTYGNCSSFKVPPPVREYKNNLVIEEINCMNLRDPQIWGPIFWFQIFLSCCSADETIPRASRSKYWKFVEGLVWALPCEQCREHGQEFVAKHKHRRDDICSSRRNLTKFFVDLHNDINKRKGLKAKLTLQDVENRFMAEGPVSALKIKYT